MTVPAQLAAPNGTVVSELTLDHQVRDRVNGHRWVLISVPVLVLTTPHLDVLAAMKKPGRYKGTGSERGLIAQQELREHHLQVNYQLTDRGLEALRIAGRL